MFNTNHELKSIKLDQVTGPPLLAFDPKCYDYPNTFRNKADNGIFIGLFDVQNNGSTIEVGQ